MTFRASIDLGEAFLALDEQQEAFERAARPAAQAGSEVLYQAVLRNVAALGKKTGNYARSIYQAHSDRESGDGRELYDISWNHRKAPHGHLIEDGYIQKFKVYVGKDGKWYTNKKAPLPEPKQIAGKAPVRRAAAFIPQAQDAMLARFWQELGL